MTVSRLSERPRASVKVRAALAGGLVFGLAAGLTVASWTDAERVGATFTASSFGLQVSLNGAAYSNASSVTASVSGVYPGSPLYIPLKVETATVSIAGTVSLSAAANSTNLDAVLRYRIVKTLLTCNAAAFTTSPIFVVGGAGPATYQQVSTALAATPGLAVAANASTEVGYCIELGMPATGVAQTNAGTSGTVTWNIVGTSA
ncbi:MAG TPA: SipW-dependent-type signal peptide-containing protein [Pseudolysinimonas sp.]|jgi:predicted ribosomally synthesized peptide with SipW-like signal peptide